MGNKCREGGQGLDHRQSLGSNEAVLGGVESRSRVLKRVVAQSDSYF